MSERTSGPPSQLIPALLHPWVWRMAWKDARSQWKKLFIFALAIVSGVAALTSIHSIKVSVEKGVDLQAKALLGADLQISSRQEFPEATLAGIYSRAEKVSREISFSSMLFFPSADAARLVQVRALDGLYPFYGKVETRPAGAWNALQQRPGILLEATLLDQFNLKIGDSVRLGESNLTILGAIVKAAPRSSRFSGLAPEAYLNLTELKSTGLLEKNSLSFHNLYLQTGDAELVKNIRSAHEKEGWRFETPESRRDTLGKALDVFQQFLGIISMVALILGAIGVASAIHTHLERRTTTIAILRCLGCPGRAAYAVYLVQSLSLAFAGALAGGALGILIHLSLLFFFQDQLPLRMAIEPEWPTALLSTAIGFAVCSAFTFLPLSRVASISPDRALNAFSVETRKVQWRSLTPVGLFLGTLLFLLMSFHVHDVKRATAMIAGLALVLAALAGVARLLIIYSRRLTPLFSSYLIRQGLSNIHRPQNQTLLFLFSLGLGAFLLLLVLLTRQAALERITIAGMKDSPNIYLVDVQTSQLTGVKELLAELQLPLLESSPIVTMRIQSIKGVPVHELQKEGKIPRWILQREFRSSYRDHPGPTETVIAGVWTNRTETPGAPIPLSLEKEIAKDLGVSIGDEMTLDIQGITMPARVTSLRQVDWSRFNLNFFMLFPPDALENAPGFNVVTTLISANTSSGILQRETAKRFPNISAIDLTLILETVRSILERVALVVQFVVGFTLLSGLAILAGTLLNGRDYRLRESALLRTLGASSRQIQCILAVEYAALGFFSGLAGSILAVLAYIPLSIWVFESSPWSGALLPLLVISASSVLSTMAGMVLSRGVCTTPPLDVLRNS